MSVRSNDWVLNDVAGPVATLTLNRPDKGNALSEAMMDALEDRLHEANANPAVRVIVLAARGRIFCAGHDLSEMRAHENKDYHEALFARCSRLMGAVRGSPKPVIAKVQGAAVAAGCQLVATADLAYAVETAKFGVNGINLGLFCSTPSVALSRSVAPKQALDLLLTGRLILAPRAAEIGLINAAVPADALDGAVNEAAAAIAAKLADAIGLGKETFYRQLALDIDEAYAVAGERMAENLSFPETHALIDAFITKH
jgi:enoyl-CoA hydratase/carnithine racemase